MKTLFETISQGVSAFDSLNNFAGDFEGMEKWNVLLGRNRDSGILTNSNFNCAVEKLGGEGTDVQIFRFGHWACGWFELLCINPANEVLTSAANDIETDLADYPVLNDQDYSDREWEAKNELWANCYSHKEKVELCKKAGLTGRQARCKYIPSDVDMYIDVD
jgi:hypothetical protein